MPKLRWSKTQRENFARSIEQRRKGKIIAEHKVSDLPTLNLDGDKPWQEMAFRLLAVIERDSKMSEQLSALGEYGMKLVASHLRGERIP